MLSSAVSLVPSGAGAQSPVANQRVIIVLKNQERGLPATRRDIGARRQAIQKTQAPLTAQLSASRARNVRSYDVLNAISATVTGSEVSQLRSNGAVQEVVPDEIIHMAPNPDLTAAMESASRASGSSSSAAGSVCSTSKPQLNPQALETIHADSDTPGAQTARSLGFNGSGVTVGYIADGLDINNPDFIRANGQHVFVDYKDFSGEGTNTVTGGEEAFGDAGSIAAQGRETYDVSGYGPHASTTPCKIRVEGVAPGASLVGLSIFGANNAGYNSTFLDAINYAVTVDHVNVLNESLGNNYYPDDAAALDLIKQANDAAVAAGTTVTASSGDAGVTNTIGTPATDPNVIAAGATTTYRSDLQDGYGGAQFPGVTGYLNNDISSFSSGGFEQSGATLDVVAPGELNWSLCSTNVAIYEDCFSYGGKPTPVIPFGGTSESAPLTAGVAALVIQAYAKTHGTDPTPAVVKQIIASTADDINSPANQQGAGLIDAYKAVQAAESYSAPSSTPTPTGDTLLDSATQLNAVTAAGASHTFTETITNNGAESQTIALSGRVLGPYTSIKTQTVTLSDSASPKTTDWAGVPANYEPVTFTVPAGQDRLNASIAFQNASASNLNARVRLTLVDPNGNLAAYSVPQGDGNYGNVQVTDPASGTWTAYIWSKTAANGGTNGPVKFGAQTANYQPLSTTPSQVTLAPGASAPVSVTIAAPSTPGDYTGSLVMTSNRGPSFGRTTSVPLTLRSLIPQGRQSFTQTLTGGNGRSVVTGQAFYYQLDVPQGRPELNATVALADNPNNPFTAFLVSPSGEARAVSANALLNGNQVTSELGAQLHVLNPSPGAWTLIVAFIPQVSGTALSEPFTVSTSEDQVPASAPGLPNSARTRLAAGTPVTYKVRVTNNGPQPEEYFLDARLDGSTTLSLAALGSPDTTVPLTFSQNVPVYLMPTEATAFGATASTTGTEPIEFDAEGPAGDPDVGSSAGQSAVGSLRSDAVSQGVWDIAPTVTGAYGATPATNEPVHTTMTATAAPFDTTATSPTGDLWQASTNPAALNSLSPVIVGPGQTGTINVTLTPSGASGTTVSGTLFVDDESSVLFGQFYSPNGDEVAALPYSYSIK